jgi:hypothetical protein
MQNGGASVVSYTCRANPRYMGWREDMCPLLFAAQFNPRTRLQSVELDAATWTLTEAFRPMMSLFILYYLDTRASPSEPLPFWMVLFGIVYNEDGAVVRGHCPCFRPRTNGLQEDREEVGWRARSWAVDTFHCEALAGSPSARGPLLFILNRIQGHCKLVLERLKAWEGYCDACQLLGVPPPH